MKGHFHRQSATSFRLVVYTGRDPETGKKRQETRTVPGTTDAEAEAALRRLLVEVDRGIHSGPTMTVAQLLDRWLERRKQRSELEVATWDDYRRVADQHIIPAIGGRRLNRLKIVHIDEMYDNLRDVAGLGPARIRRCHSVLQGALQYAVRKDWMERNLASEADPPVVKRRKVKGSPLDVVVQVLAYAAEHAPDLMAWLFVAAATGARRGEVCGIEWGDLDEETGSLLLVRSISTPKGRFIVKSTKTEDDHPIAVDEVTMAVLASHRLRAKELALKWGYSFDESTPMFISPESGRHWRGDVTGHRIAELCEAAGVKTNARALRHFAATELIAAGFDPVTVGGRLRHLPSTTTDIYADVVPAKDREAAAYMGRLLSN